MEVTDLPGVAIKAMSGCRTTPSVCVRRRVWPRSGFRSFATFATAGKATGKEVAKAQAELPEALKAEKATRGLADQAFAVWSKVKTWVERSDAEVEPTEPPKINGVDLAECRNKKLAVIDQLAKLRSLPAPSDRALVETFIAELGGRRSNRLRRCYGAGRILRALNICEWAWIAMCCPPCRR